MPNLSFKSLDPFLDWEAFDEEMSLVSSRFVESRFHTSLTLGGCGGSSVIHIAKLFPAGIKKPKSARQNSAVNKPSNAAEQLRTPTSRFITQPLHFTIVVNFAPSIRSIAR